MSVPTTGTEKWKEISIGIKITYSKKNFLSVKNYENSKWIKGLAEFEFCLFWSIFEQTNKQMNK